MLIFIPILLLLLFAIVIGYFGRYRWPIGTSWLITAGAVVLVWILMIVIRIKLPTGFQVDDWSPLGVGSGLLVFNVTSKTWIFSFLLVSLLSGVIFTDTVRLGQSNNLITWTAAMILTAMGLFSIYSQSLLAVIITWSLIDIVEFGILIRVINHPRVHYASILEFSTRIMGTILIICGLIFSGSHNVITAEAQYSNIVYLLVVVGTTLRLGILPLHVPLTANLPIRRSLGTLLRFVAPLSALSFLAQVQPHLSYPGINNLLFGIGLITAVYGAIKWGIAKNELAGRPFWMLAFYGLILISFVNGQVEGLIALSISMTIFGGFIFLSSFRSKFVTGLGIACLVLMVGFPFSPSAPIWSSLLKSYGLINLLLVSTILLMCLGFLRQVLRVRESSSFKEPWMQLFYSIGLAFLVTIPLLTLIWRFRDLPQNIDLFPPMITSIGVTLIFWIMHSKLGKRLLDHPGLVRGMKPIKLIGNLVNEGFQFDWFFGLLRGIFSFFEKPLKFFIGILEGDGGLLWALLFLALISSVIIGKVMP